MPYVFAIFYVLVAGVINGSFALPTKNVKHWSFENIWLSYSFWAFLLLPWIFLFIIDESAFHFYATIPSYELFIIFIGGIAFGIGMVCFAVALDKIGLALGFLLNIGISTGLGFCLPLIFLHTQEVFTPFGLFTFIGTILILCGLLVGFKAGKIRDTEIIHDHSAKKQNKYYLGVLLATIAGFASAGENFTFAATTNLQHMALADGISALAAANIIWPLFLTFTLIPYAVYMLFLHRKNASFVNYRHSSSTKYSFAAFTMAIFWYGSLILYSKASLVIGTLGPIVGWPLFMVCIILTSNYWGWHHKEWSQCPIRAKRLAARSVVLLIFAVLVLGFSITLSH
ncbi:MAG: L-rhamnose/proton symporter RhaT [Pseudomonadota bacterium]